MTVSLIVAMTKGRVIGRENQMPWHLPEDLKLFKKVTTGHIIAMGRKTYESIGRPLPNRENFVISKTVDSIEGCRVFKNIKECIDAAENYDKKLFFIGGGTIYAEAVKFADEMHISWVKEDFEGDTYFPEFDISEWEEAGSEEFEKFIYVKYIRKA